MLYFSLGLAKPGPYAKCLFCVCVAWDIYKYENKSHFYNKNNCGQLVENNSIINE